MISNHMEDEQTCAGCHTHFEDRKLQKCSSCKMIRYCSVECQKQDWANHKQSCKEYLELNRRKKAADKVLDVEDFPEVLTALASRCGNMHGNFGVWTYDPNIDAFTENENSIMIAFKKCPHGPECLDGSISEQQTRHKGINFDVIDEGEVHETIILTYETHEHSVIKNMPTKLFRDFTRDNCRLMVDQEGDICVISVLYNCGHRFNSDQWNQKFSHRH